MNGIWECTSSTFSAGDPVPQAIPEKFDNSIPVPGFWDQASIAMPNYVTSALWYRTTLTLPEKPADNAILQDVYKRQKLYRPLHSFVNAKGDIYA